MNNGPTPERKADIVGNLTAMVPAADANPRRDWLASGRQTHHPGAWHGRIEPDVMAEIEAQLEAKAHV